MKRSVGDCETARAEYIAVASPSGMHSRTAAMIAQVARRFAAEVLVNHDGRQCDGKSMVEILFLDIHADALFSIEAHGPDAVEAIQMIAYVTGEERCQEPAEADAELRLRPHRQPDHRPLQLDVAWA